MNARKLVSLAICTLLVLSFALSVAYIVREVHHDCTGEGCIICEHIRLCEGWLRSAASGLRRTAPAIAFLLILAISLPLRAIAALLKTPVTLKVKLSN